MQVLSKTELDEAMMNWFDQLQKREKVEPRSREITVEITNYTIREPVVEESPNDENN